MIMVSFSIMEECSVLSEVRQWSVVEKVRIIKMA